MVQSNSSVAAAGVRLLSWGSYTTGGREVTAGNYGGQHTWKIKCRSIVVFRVAGKEDVSERRGTVKWWLVEKDVSGAVSGRIAEGRWWGGAPRYTAGRTVLGTHTLPWMSKWRRRNDGRAVERNRGLKGLIISAQAVAREATRLGTSKGKPRGSEL